MEVFYKYARTYLKDSVYAASDGVVAIFSLVAGITGASLHFSLVLILGFANVFAEAFSMATGNFIGSRAEGEMYQRGRRIQDEIIREHPENSQKSIERILQDKGYEGTEKNDLVRLIMHDKNFAVDLIMDEDLGITKPERGRPLRGSIITFFSFALAGTVPLLPYAAFLHSGMSHLFFVAVLFTGVELFTLGALRSILSDRSWVVSGAEMLLFGGIAAAIAYSIGAFLRGTIGAHVGLY